MAKAEDFEGGAHTTCCPGCGNFAILNAVKKALAGLNIAPHEVMIFSGIGQAAKLPLYMRCNAFNGLHGRALPLATGGHYANHEIKTIVVGGDGDGFAEGGNHFLHAVRRNPDMAYFVHDNQVYGLTRGQASPTSDRGFVTSVTPNGVAHERFNPPAVAIALNASFVARTHTGVMEHMVKMMQLAIQHRGFAFLEILQHCVSYNRVNTIQWYRDRAYDTAEEKGYDPTDRLAAFERALQWGERFPIGVIYRCDRPTMADSVATLKDGALVQSPVVPRDISRLVETFR
jgi:2-oxoglutarate ferredoxin oxidoreductase subunit beta